VILKVEVHHDQIEFLVKTKNFNLYSIYDAFRPKQMHDLTKKQTANKNDSLKAHVAKYISLRFFFIFFLNSPTYKEDMNDDFHFFLKNKNTTKKIYVLNSLFVIFIESYFSLVYFTSSIVIPKSSILLYAPKNRLLLFINF
jgi:hypothetical protein